ncbi:EF-P 5-aminopentanol modification-associated protein YfmH [Kyrpidia tusciae]|uniref:Peptidase M16 domain protein n=1 Tax=Kyrpidia tusciae (strain DSM 2912 / NBRC 15312 / T2) TaxID=562970 RepID=D5WWW5_KYRT2|nr:pitrilysin family protein [Kyrpidia tusciae]ADG05816.1 peptidase M16 domain protein [Kyrpidia tusciae DSM 2912]
MRERKYDQLGVRMVEHRCANGLAVTVLPKPGYNQVFATYSTNFGSIDHRFRSGDGREIQVPDGVAHFLEHKMFEKKEGDVFRLFASRAASANAYTTFDMTAYLFSATHDILENLETLLDFVDEPYFTDETVEKEKGIIAQEIRMYEDNPDARVYFQLLKGLYEHHPVRIQIAGTVESIRAISKEDLYTCYRGFYHPQNMHLLVVGGIDPETVIETVEKNQEKKADRTVEGPAQRLAETEPDRVFQSRQECEMPVNTPRIFVGYKDVGTEVRGAEGLKRDTVTSLLFDALFTKGGPLYGQLFEKQLIDQSFGWEYDYGRGYAHAVIGGNTPEPERFLEVVAEGWRQVEKDGIADEILERSRKRLIGQFVKSLDSLRFLARYVTAYHFKEMDLFATIPALQAVKREDVEARLRELIRPERQAVSLVRPVN